MAEFIPSQTTLRQIEDLVERHRYSKLESLALDYNSTLDRKNLNLAIEPSLYNTLQLIFVLITRGIDIPFELIADLIPNVEYIIGALSSSRYTIGQGEVYSETGVYKEIPSIYYLYIYRHKLKPYLLATVNNTSIGYRNDDDFLELFETFNAIGNNIEFEPIHIHDLIRRLNPDGLFLLAASLEEQPQSFFSQEGGVDNFAAIVKP